MAIVLGIITARGGSKGIPKKNIRQVAGKPLIAYTIEAAQSSKLLSDVILSTDSEEIAKCASEYGLKANDLRPSKYATDTARNIDAVIYEMKKYEQVNTVLVDIVVLLQPTTPLRTSTDIDNALKMFLENEEESLISVYRANFAHPQIMYYLSNGRVKSILSEGKVIQRRQEFRDVFVRNGALYIATRNQIVLKENFIGENMLAYEMPRSRSVNIDEPYDLHLAEWLINSEVSE